MCHMTLLMLTGCLALAALSAPTASAVPTATLLVPAIGEAERAGVARGVFYSRTHELTVGAGELLLSSSPDGAGELCTDDQATLTFRRPDAPPQQWSRLFADPASGSVICAPPQRLRLAAGPGRYQVEVTLSDRFPFTYSSRPYFLIAPAGEGEAADAALPLAAVAQITPPATAVPIVTASPPRTYPTTTSPMAAPTGALAPSTVAAAGAPAAGPPRVAVAGWWLPTLPAVVAVTLAAMAIAVLRRRRRAAAPPPPLLGLVDLFDRRTGERRTALLQRFSAGAALLRDPLDLVAAESEAPGERLIALILPGAAGPQLRVGGPAPRGPTPLREGETILIDRAVELRYRGAPASYTRTDVIGRRR